MPARPPEPLSLRTRDGGARPNGRTRGLVISTCSDGVAAGKEARWTRELSASPHAAPTPPAETVGFGLPRQSSKGPGRLRPGAGRALPPATESLQGKLYQLLSASATSKILIVIGDSGGRVGVAPR